MSMIAVGALRRRLFRVGAGLAGALLLAGWPGDARVLAQEINFNQPRRDYAVTNLQGWTVWVEAELPARHPALHTNSLARLDRNLALALDRLPRHSHPLLRERKIFLMLGELSSLGGRNNGADYFQPHAPQHYPHIDPRMGSSIVVYSATNYVWLSDLWALKLLIHEFAHAWQLEQWPERQPDILQAYELAMARQLYLKVKDEHGRDLETAYAATNQLEYFAELSCMYFATCNYFPHTRSDLESYDPGGTAMVRRLWRLDGAAPFPLP